MDPRKYSTMNSLASVFLDSANNTGMAVKKKNDLHNIAAANKANARYRWH